VRCSAQRSRGLKQTVSATGRDAVHSLEEGFGLEYVADLLGHASIRSTAIYAKVTTAAREAMMRRLDRSRFVLSW